MNYLWVFSKINQFLFFLPKMQNNLWNQLDDQIFLVLIIWSLKISGYWVTLPTPKIVEWSKIDFLKLTGCLTDQFITWVGWFLNPSKVIDTMYVCDAATMRRIQEDFRIPRSNSAISPNTNGCTKRNTLHSPKQGIWLWPENPSPILVSY